MSKKVIEATMNRKGSTEAICIILHCWKQQVTLYNSSWDFLGAKKTIGRRLGKALCCVCLLALPFS